MAFKARVARCGCNCKKKEKMTSTENRNNIVLIGMPGAGKSTLGVVAAKMLNMKFLDVDLLIQDVCGATLPELINRLGTEGFIEKESQILQSISTNSPTIISTGGSAVYTEAAMAHLRSIGRVVYLRVTYDELVRRIGCESMEARGVVLRGGAGSGARASVESAAHTRDNAPSTSDAPDASDAPGAPDASDASDAVVYLKDVYDQRASLYEKYADLVVDVDGLPTGEAARKLSDALFNN